MNNRLRIAVVIAVALSLVSCIHHVPRSKGMADIDIDEPPPQMERPERIVPAVAPIGATKAVMARPVWEIGRAEQGDGDGRGFQYNYGAEIGLSAGVESANRATPSFESMVGINAGCGPCHTGHFGFGRYYGEAHWAKVFFEPDSKSPFFLPFVRISLGWSFQPTIGAHGPQVTLTLGEILHFRWYRHLKESSSFLFGVSFPVGVVLSPMRQPK